MTRVSFDIPINDDVILEGNENFMLTVDPTSLPPTGVSVGNPGQATVTIVDNDRKQFYYNIIMLQAVNQVFLISYIHTVIFSLMVKYS